MGDGVTLDVGTAGVDVATGVGAEGFGDELAVGVTGVVVGLGVGAPGLALYDVGPRRSFL